MKARWWILLLVAAVVAIAAARCVVFVDETEVVIVTQFGRPVETLQTAGLSFKAPYQSTLRIDRRLQIYDPRPSEFLTDEKKNLNLDVFVCWKVDDPQKFLESVTDFAGAQSRIHDIVFAELAATIGQNPLEAIVSIGPEHQLDRLVGEVADRSRQRLLQSSGIRLVDVRLKRISIPADEQVRQAVFDRMRSERATLARRYRAEGEEAATKIRAEANKQKTITLADAYAQAEETRGRAEAEATKIYADAHQTDPDFYELTRTLEAYRKFLDEKTTILLSSDSDLLKYLTRRSPPVTAPPESLPAATQPATALRE